MANAADRVYAAIRARIENGAYPSGRRLKEEELAEELGVSRTPVRDALRRLRNDQLVRFVPNRGAFVTAWSVEDADQIFVLRSLLEAYAAELASEKITEAELLRLQELAHEIDAAAQQRSEANHRRIAVLNNEFHRMVLAAAHSRRLEETVSWLVELPLVLQTLERFDDADLQRSCSQHHELIAALRARDRRWASAVMRAHILAARNIYLQAPWDKPGG
ncbi:MAG: GntR family transcriptional regulator [Deltaproteobacteria bacterium]|nr:GntR family transcriptional regulator [Deltaproteobacteria bacterium]